MTGKVANLSNYPNGFTGGLLLEGIPTLREHSGKVFYVGDTNSAAYPNRKGASDINKGGFLDPFSTLDHAVEQCTAKRGDVIRILPGTVLDIETSVAIDVEGIAIVGMGFGDDRGQITPGVANALDIEASNVTVANVYFNEADAAITTSVDVIGSDVHFVGNHFDLGANDTEVITLGAATADGFKFVGNEVVVTANGTDDVIDAEAAVDRLYVDDNTFVTSVANFDSAAVEAAGVAITNAFIGAGNKVIGGGTLFAGTADVGTIQEDGPGVQRPVEITAITDETTSAGWAGAPAINGNVWIHGVWFVYNTADDVGNDVTVATETGITIIASDTEVEGATAAGDVVYAAAQGSTGVVDEVGTAETVLMTNPILVTGAANAENLIDVTFAGGTEGDATMYVAWSPADDVSTSEVESS